MLKGSCQCGIVRFDVTDVPTAPTACHCVQCRKQSGHYLASANVPKASVSITGVEHLTWYQSSEKVKRGFCSKCGSWLVPMALTSSLMSPLTLRMTSVTPSMSPRLIVLDLMLTSIGSSGRSRRNTPSGRVPAAVSQTPGA